MKNILLWALLLCGTLAGPVAWAASPLPAPETLSHGRFQDVVLYRPAGEVRQVVLFLSGSAGWNGPVVPLAEALAGRGVMVAGISTPQLASNLARETAACVFPDGDLENLAHFLQGYARLPTYHTPLLAGLDSGGALAYALIAEAPSGIFAGALSIGFQPGLDLGKPLCREGSAFHRAGIGSAMELTLRRPKTPWQVVNAANPDPAALQAQVLAAFTRLAGTAASASLPLPPGNLSDLPLIEVAATGRTADTFAVLLSGDGGWAGLDKQLAGALAARGIGVVGVDSLRYFWSPRTPALLAADIDRIVLSYAARWRKSRVLLVGYSQGADVLPFAFNRLPAPTRQMVSRLVLMGLGQKAAFEFHLGNWLGQDHAHDLPIRPEALQLSADSTLCLYGADEGDSLCPQLPPGNVRALSLPGGHHFDGAYDELARVILSTP